MADEKDQVTEVDAKNAEPTVEPTSDAVEVTGAEQSSPPPSADSVQDDLRRLREQLLRTAADFDNFRKRTRRELGEAERKGREDLVRELLPVFDNLERATQHAGTASDVKALADGLNMVIRLFGDTLSKSGIERVPAVGTPFDPTIHEAIQSLETAEFPPGTVAAEVQAGYRIGDKLVRAAMVVVAKAPKVTDA